QDGHEVVAHVELHARVLEGLEAALVGRVLGRVGLVEAGGAGKGPAQHLRQDPYRNAHQDEQEDRQVLVKVHRGTLVSARAAPGTGLRLLESGAVGETRTRTAFATTPSR